MPTVTRVVLWGLCDAASAALMYAAADSRVCGLALLNPWVRSEATLAKAQLKHYYAARVFDRTFWRKLASGEFRPLESLGGFLRAAFSAGTARRGSRGSPASFQSRMLRGLRAFGGETLLVLSGDDLTAQEFLEHTAGDGAWMRALDSPQVTRHEISEADHTFSRSDWQRAVEAWTLAWVRRLGASTGD